MSIKSIITAALALLIPQAHGGGLSFDHNNRGTTIYTFFRFLPLYWYTGTEEIKESKGISRQSL
jgi:hypothetical protein